MLHYYIETGYRTGLSRVHRAMTLLSKINIECEVYVSDFSAVEFIKDVYGYRGVTGIDQIENLSKIAIRYTDSLIYDSSIVDIELLESLQRYFNRVVRISSSDKLAYKKEFLVSPLAEDSDNSIKLFIPNSIDSKQSIFTDIRNIKRQKALFFYNDFDYKKNLLNYIDKLKYLNADFLLGNYFFLDYEDNFKDSFNSILQPEYYQIFSLYDDIYTSNIQLALSAKLLCKNVVFIDFNSSGINSELLMKYEIDIVNISDISTNIDIANFKLKKVKSKEDTNLSYLKIEKFIN